MTVDRAKNVIGGEPRFDLCRMHRSSINEHRYSFKILFLSCLQFEWKMNIDERGDRAHFDLEAATGAPGAAVSVPAVGFLDFMTIATIRCSSMRKARIMLKRTNLRSYISNDQKPTEDEQLQRYANRHKHVRRSSIVWSCPYVVLVVML
jgi:hypothetical protein